VASIQANPNPNLEENTFMHKTWGFLRSSSDQVGSAAADVLSLQGNLEELQKNLGVEYDAWTKTKQTLLQENEELKNTKAHLEGEIQAQGQQHLELTRLQDSIAENEKALTWEATSLEQQVTQWQKEKSLMEKNVADIEAQIAAVAKQEEAAKAAALAETRRLRDQKAEQQHLVYDRTQELMKQNNALAQLKIDSGRKHAELISQNQAAMKEVEMLQKDIQQTAQVQHALLSLKARVGAQVDQKVQEKDEASRLAKRCQADAEALDRQIKQVSAQTAEFREQIRGCQALDGENQKLIADLNACQAKLHR